MTPSRQERNHPTSSSSSSISPTTTVLSDSETWAREDLSGIDSHPVSVSSSRVERIERGVVVVQANQKSKTKWKRKSRYRTGRFVVSPTSARMQHDVDADFKVRLSMVSERNDDWSTWSASLRAYVELTGWIDVLEKTEMSTASISMTRTFLSFQHYSSHSKESRSWSVETSARRVMWVLIRISWRHWLSGQDQWSSSCHPKLIRRENIRNSKREIRMDLKKYIDNLMNIIVLFVGC